MKNYEPVNENLPDLERKGNEENSDTNTDELQPDLDELKKQFTKKELAEFKLVLPC